MHFSRQIYPGWNIFVSTKDGQKYFTSTSTFQSLLISLMIYLQYLCIAMVHFQYFGIFHTTKHWYLIKICIKTIWQYFWGRFARQRLRRWEFPVDWGWWPSNGPPTESVTPHPWKGGFLELTCIDMRDGSFKTPFLLHSQGKV